MKRLLAAFLCVAVFFSFAPAMAEEDEEALWTAPAWVVPEGYEDIITRDPEDGFAMGSDSVLWDKPGLREITLPASMDEATFGQFMVETRALFEWFWYDTYSYLEDEGRDEPIPDYYAPGFALEKIHIAPAHKSLCSVDGVVFTKDMKTLVACPPARQGSYTVPMGVETIAAHAFEYCDSLEKIALPQTITSIGDRAFYCAGELRAINLPAAVRTMGRSALMNCVSLESLSLPSSIQMGERALWYLFSLQSLFVSEGVPMGEDALLRVHPKAAVYCAANSDASRAAAIAQLRQAEFGGEAALLKSPWVLYENPAILTADYGALDEMDTVNVLEITGDTARVDFCGETMRVPLEYLSFADPYGGFEKMLQLRDFRQTPFALSPSHAADTAEPMGEYLYPILQRFGTWYVVLDEGEIRYAAIGDGYTAANCVTENLHILLCPADLLDEKGGVIATFYPGEQAVVDGEEVRIGGLSGRMEDAVFEKVETESFMPGF